MKDPDESLLLSFALHRDEGAFRQLTERYLGLIFHTALRRTGNYQMSQEACLNVLCAVSRKAAALAKKPRDLRKTGYLILWRQNVPSPAAEQRWALRIAVILS